MSPLGRVFAWQFLCRGHGPLSPGKEGRNRERAVNSQTTISLVHAPAHPCTPREDPVLEGPCRDADLLFREN